MSYYFAPRHELFGKRLAFPQSTVEFLTGIFASSVLGHTQRCLILLWVKTRLRLIWCEWMMHFCIFGSNPRVCSLLRSRALLAVFRQVRKLLAATWMNGRPPVGCYKCNVDTAHLEQNGAVGFAAVVCDYDGHVVKCFPEFEEALLNPCLAEAFAIHEVLS
ncbi:hypothetical protein GOBAR_AA01116 [Gossypium barbadense]|uniref:Uncharacterized protein n=1 Tax=Gossypium barbadense TaxID=3634 RepID=A0A2P5YV34_GOSBA|nr:hypothetical protein GOBAR_AA01116 [Gossypium barbadense]